MPEPFLHHVARHLREYFPEEQEQVCIVFPNRRAKVFFRKELSRLNPQVQWLPDIFSSEDFVRELTRLQICEPVAQLFELYEVYAELEGTKAESFDVFSTWASQLLHDYQEIDLYMTDTRQLFGSIDAAYALKSWSPDGKVLTANQEQYLRFWSRMSVWYTAFRERLQQKGMATSAMAFRQLAEQIEILSGSLPWKHILFAGFNALNGAEQRFMRYLEQSGKATLLWDTDPYYLDNELNEAGLFLRKLKKKWDIRSFNRQESLLEYTPKEIKVIGVARNLGQAWVAGSILDTLAQKNADLTDTAVVLADEQLLMPVLEALPQHTGQINITMGYPLHLLPVSNLFQLVFELHAKARMTGKDGNREPAYYFRDMLRLLRNPLLAASLDQGAVEAFIRRINTEKHIFLPLHFILENPGEVHTAPLSAFRFLLEPWNNSVEQALDCFTRLIAALRTALKERNAGESLEMEALFSISQLINKLSGWKSSFRGFTDIRTLQRIFSQLIKQETLPFYGEPLTGLQLMGLLETRNLDFNNVILLSANEGILPAAKVHRSFIPHDISLAFGLPTYRERDAVFAYHFYRLLQRAGHVWLVHNTETDEMGKGEQSRFITQLQEELKSPQVKLTSITYLPRLGTPGETEISIPKSTALQERLKQYVYEKGLSPTSLATFVNCTLQFYFRYLSNVKVEETKEDDIGLDILGRVVHAVLEDFFRTFEGHTIRSSDIDPLFVRVPEKVREKFLEERIDERDLDYGKNLLTSRGAEKMLLNYLRSQQRELRQLETEGRVLKIEQVEIILERRMHVTYNGETVEVLFKGYADRLDRLDGILRIVDYKSGSVLEKELKLDDLFEVTEDPGKSKALQLLQYAFMAGETERRRHLDPGIISLRRPSAGLLQLQVGKEPGLAPELQEAVEDIFALLAGRLLDAGQPFEQTQDYSRCEWCDFRQVCNR